MKLLCTMLIMAFTINISAQEVRAYEPVLTAEIPGFKMYPNPAFDGVIYITTAQNAQKDIRIYDVFGKVVLQARVTDTRVDIKNLDPGVYMMQVAENNKGITRKLVVK